MHTSASKLSIDDFSILSMFALSSLQVLAPKIMSTIIPSLFGKKTQDILTTLDPLILLAVAKL